MNVREYWQTFLGGSDVDTAFANLLHSFRGSLKVWEWFVNWAKVYGNRNSFEVSLNTLNYVAGKPNPELALREVLAKQPTVAGVLPILIATREQQLTVVEATADTLSDLTFNFNKAGHESLGGEELNHLIEFARRCGIIELFRNVRSLPDYVLGVEVGLDTNSRKNRSGTAMERLVAPAVLSLEEQGASALIQATPSSIESEWGKRLPYEKATRKFDFAVLHADVVTVIEVNFYSTSGSKLNSTAGQYADMAERLVEHGHRFVWVTDGAGWHDTTEALRQAFPRIGFILSLDVLRRGALHSIVLGQTDHAPDSTASLG